MPRPRPAAIVLLAAVALVAFAALGAGLWLWQDRARTIEEGERLARTLSRVLEEQTQRTVQAVDLTLSGMVETLDLSPVAEHDPEFQDVLRRRLAALPYIRALFVIGPDGFITQDTDYPLTPRVSLADRDYFEAHRQNPDLGLQIGPPLLSRSVGTWFVSMSRRLRAPEGGFAGIAVAAVEPIYFAGFYEELDLGPQDSIALLSRDGTLIVRHPHRDDLMGASLADSELFRRLARGMRTGSYHTESLFDGVHRILSYRALDDQPLVVVVGLAEEALLAPWRGRAVATGIATALLAALVAFVAVLAVRYWRRDEQIRSQLMQAQRLEALGRLTGGVVHDFNNLLAVVASALRLIEARRSSDSRIAEFAGMARSAVDQGSRLVARLLAFSRQQELELRPLSPNLLIQELEPLLKGAVGPARLELELAPDVGQCRLDVAQFDAALLNLAINARDAMPRGGVLRIATDNQSPPATATGGGALSQGSVRVSVQDTGEGMPRDALQRALEPFFTTKGEAGTGLGLSQVYGFVRQVNGDLRIDSSPGTGTTVHLYFPRVQRHLQGGDVDDAPVAGDGRRRRTEATRSRTGAQRDALAFDRGGTRPRTG